MERKFLEEFGLEKEAIDKILDANSADVGKVKKSGEAAAERIAELEAQAAETSEKLKAVEGMDVAGKDAKIAELQASLEAQAAESQQKMANRDFADLLKDEIAAAKGKNPKAITALLDTEALKSSKNQKEDAAAAIKALAESDAYLFEAATDTTKTVMKVSTGGSHTESGGDSDPFTAAAMKGAGLTSEKGE